MLPERRVHSSPEVISPQYAGVLQQQIRYVEDLVYQDMRTDGNGWREWRSGEQRNHGIDDDHSGDRKREEVGVVGENVAIVVMRVLGDFSIVVTSRIDTTGQDPSMPNECPSLSNNTSELCF